MKKIIVLIAVILISMGVHAQVPESISYQCVIRNANNEILENQPVGIRISIIVGSANGEVVYQEIYNPNPNTNFNGLVSLQIGEGIPLTGSFEDIDWSNGPIFLKSETDPTGGTNYTIIGTTQILSVPYALFAKTAENITGEINETDPDFNEWDKSTGITISKQQIIDLGEYIEEETDPIFSSSVASAITANDTSYWNNKQNKLVAGNGIQINGDTISTTSVNGSYYVGQPYGGGVIFWVDHTGEHGLIVSMIDLSTSLIWSNINNAMIGTTNDWDGTNNTTAIVNQNGHTSSAAQICQNYTNEDYGTGIYSDWYLPSVGEMNLLWSSFYQVQKTIISDGNPSTMQIVRNRYWTSTEGSQSGAWYYDFAYGAVSGDGKGTQFYVRSVRKF